MILYFYYFRVVVASLVQELRLVLVEHPVQPLHYQHSMFQPDY